MVTLSLAGIDGPMRRLLSRHADPETFIRFYSAARPIALELSRLGFPTVTPPAYPLRPFIRAPSLLFRNDLGVAAGYDKDGRLLERNHALGAGFAVVGTQLNGPHPGNLIRAFGRQANPWTPLPRSGSAINSLGLPSRGIDVAIDNIRRFRERHDTHDFPIGISIMGHPRYEAGSGMKEQSLLDVLERALPVADFIEINESCPNVTHDSPSDTVLQQRLSRMVARRNGHARYVPLVIKMGDFGDPRETVRFLTRIGIDGISGLNTQKDYENLLPGIHPLDFGIYLAYTQSYQGGVSGRAIKERAFRQVAAVSDEISRQDSPLVLMHVGGIETHQDVAESRNHAPLRQWYTGLMTAQETMPLREIYHELVRGDVSRHRRGGRR